MSLTALLFFLIALTHSITGYYVLRANRSRAANRSFALLAISVGLWILTLTVTHHSTEHSTLLTRLTFLTGTILPFAFVRFVIASVEDRQTRRYVHSVALLTTLTACGLTLSPAIVAHATIDQNRLMVNYGVVYPIWLVYMLIYVASGIVVLARAYRRASGVLRFRLHYIILGLILPTCGIVTTNVIFPFVLGWSHIGYYGPVFSLPFLLCTAHAIVRSRFLDVNLVLKEGSAWALAILAALLPVLAVLTASWRFFSARLDSSELYLMAIGALVTSSVALFLRDVASQLLDRVFHRTRANFHRIVRTASTWLTKAVNLEALLEHTVDTIAESLAVDSVIVYLKSEEGHWHLAATNEDTLRVSHRQAKLASYLTATFERKVAIVPQESGLHSNEASLGDDFDSPALIVPIVFDNVVTGCLTLGTKKSGDPYYPQDIDLLSTLANQAGVAIRNAQLYEQVALINEHLRNIVSTIESGVVAVNEAERVTMFNNAAERLSGLASDEMVGRELSDLPVAVADSLRVTLASGLPRVVPEVELAHVGSAHPVPVICCTSPLRGPTGGLVGAVAVFSDLTPLKELEMERQRAERLAYFETLAAGIAHEIKNPLVAIKTFLQLLPRRFNDPQFRDEFGRVAGREIGRMEHLVARLQSLAKPGGRIHHPVDLRAPVNDALELLQPRLEEKAITTQWSAEPGPCLVMGDHAELEQLFLNLFINALEAMGPRGALTVRLSCQDAAAAVAVEDTGPGIRDDLLGKIFDPFVTTKLHGSGLGLAICSSIATAHRARLRAVNKPGGRGAIFTVELPLGTQVATPLNA